MASLSLSGSSPGWHQCHTSQLCPWDQESLAELGAASFSGQAVKLKQHSIGSHARAWTHVRALQKCSSLSAQPWDDGSQLSPSHSFCPFHTRETDACSGCDLTQSHEFCLWAPESQISPNPLDHSCFLIPRRPFPVCSRKVSSFQAAGCQESLVQR